MQNNLRSWYDNEDYLSKADKKCNLTRAKEATAEVKKAQRKADTGYAEGESIPCRRHYGRLY